MSGTLTFQPGQTSANAVVRVISDNTDESDERFVVNFGNVQGAGATLADNQAIMVIYDDDNPPPAVSITT